MAEAFHPDPNTLDLIIGFHYNEHTVISAQHAAQFFLNVAVDLELLNNDPEAFCADVEVPDGQFSFYFSDHSHGFILMLDFGHEFTHSIDFTRHDQPIDGQPDFTECETIVAHIGSTGDGSHELTEGTKLKAHKWKVLRKTSVKHDGKIILPVEVEAERQVLNNPETTDNERADVFKNTFELNRQQNNPWQQLETFQDMVGHLLKDRKN